MRNKIKEWEFIGYNQKDKAPEGLMTVLDETNLLLNELYKKHKMQFIRAYVGTAYGEPDRWVNGQFIILIVVSEKDNLSQKQLDAYKTVSAVEEAIEKRIDNGVSIGFMSYSKHFNEEAVRGDHFFYKRVYNEVNKKPLSRQSLHRRFSMMLDPTGAKFCPECGGVCGNSKHGRF